MKAIEEFGEFLLDQDRFSFTYGEAEELAISVGQSVATLVIRELKSYGFSMEARKAPVRVRGFQTSSNDRYFGPGCMPSHGGSGWEQISGFAGGEG